MSSSAIFGKRTGTIKEDDKKDPDTPYGLNKLFEETAVEYWIKEYDIKANIYRVFACYRPSQTSGGVFGKFLQAIKDKSPLKLFNEGLSRRDFNYVTDIVDALIMSAATGRFVRTYNLGTGRLVSIAELAREVSDNIAKIGKPVSNDILADNRRAKVELGWNPGIDISKGVRDSLSRMGLKR